MANTLRNRTRRSEVIPIDLPMSIWGFSRLENILYAISKLREHHSEAASQVVGYDRVRHVGTIGANYRIISEEAAKRLGRECAYNFSYCSLEDLLRRKDEIEKAKRGKKSKYVVRNNLIIGLNPNYSNPDR